MLRGERVGSYPCNEVVVPSVTLPNLYEFPGEIRRASETQCRGNKPKFKDTKYPALHCFSNNLLLKMGFRK
jgi:hypothetical protein